jgi:hypothetical protein
MSRASIDINSMVGDISKGVIRLPEIQRAYVWKPPQIAGLMDSLYRRYPSGNLLFWETEEVVTERLMNVTGPVEPPYKRPLYLLDGQQRLTSLHRVFTGHDGALVVFNPLTEKFQMQSAATQKDARWLLVHRIVDGSLRTSAVCKELTEREIDHDPNLVEDRLNQTRDIGKYEFQVEILQDLPYEEVAEIFVRVNSRGRALKTVDLALATLSAKWPGVVDKIDREAARWAKAGYPALDAAFLVRALAAVSTPTRSLRSLPQAAIPSLEQGWAKTQRGLEHLVQLLKQNADITTSSLLPSANALVPLVAFLGSRPDTPLAAEEANALIYWLFAAFIRGRYNQSADTVIAQDVQAVLSNEPIKSLFRNVNLLDQQLHVTEQALVGRSVGSPYFFLSYLAVRAAKARDWFFGTKISTDATGAFKLEYHHIHPQSLLKTAGYAKPEINDLANLAFISARANQRISNRPPSTYFPEVGDDDLSRHYVPLEPPLREITNFRDFTAARRSKLTEAMNELLDHYRPTFLDQAETIDADPTSGERLSVTCFTEGAGALTFEAIADGSRASIQISFDEFTEFLQAVRDGLTAGLSLNGDTVEVVAGAERIEIPMGPLMVTGTLEEWDAVLERELAEARDGSPPALPPAQGDWTGRTAFSIVDSD